jgi:Protein of unknown function (DUF3572)
MRETINPDFESIALNALVWVLGDDGRAHRLLDLTGLDGDAIRGRIGDPEMLSAVLDFLCGHEPDLIACAAALNEKPETLVLARERLTR